MREVIRRFRFKAPGVPFNPFLNFFIIQNLLIGLVFTLGSHVQSVNELILFVALDDFMPLNVGSTVWGSSIILAVVFHLLWTYTRNVRIGDISTGIGFFVWAYAFVIYMLELAPMGILGIALPQVFFWGWHHIKVRRLNKYVQLGLMPCIKLDKYTSKR